ncbi:unnamed protein product [Owenia fusiformis]|uniref:Uncharacterized protein n=1 Tax=Owenia fusiformis TaxID=6347 RepID=A0A8J1TDB7_OWEFU|nr:unnamed protein product [Owenia fusiformis]
MGCNNSSLKKEHNSNRKDAGENPIRIEYIFQREGMVLFQSGYLIEKPKHLVNLALVGSKLEVIPTTESRQSTQIGSSYTKDKNQNNARVLSKHENSRRKVKEVSSEKEIKLSRSMKSKLANSHHSSSHESIVKDDAKPVHNASKTFTKTSIGLSNGDHPVHVKPRWNQNHTVARNNSNNNTPSIIRIGSNHTSQESFWEQNINICRKETKRLLPSPVAKEIQKYNPDARKILNRLSNVWISYQGALWLDQEYQYWESMGDVHPHPQFIKWQRSWEGFNIKKPVCLYTKGDFPIALDIKQGKLKDSAFLSVLVSIIEHKAMYKAIVPKDAYPVNTKLYNGQFYCNMWVEGELTRVYVDDCLPCSHSSVWGAKTSTPGEMWLPLLEKAYSKVCGSYGSIEAASPAMAFLALTGGVTECIPIMATSKIPVIDYMKPALNSGALVVAHSNLLSDDPESNNNHQQLYFTVTGIASVQMASSEFHVIQLWSPASLKQFSVLNILSLTQTTYPHMVGDLEIPSSILQELLPRNRHKREFWLPLENFLDLFDKLYICSIAPPIAQTLFSTLMKHEVQIHGEWKGRENTKSETPMFKFEVKGKCKTPVVLQLVQNILALERYQEKHPTLVDMRLDVYRIDHEEKTEKISGLKLVLDDLLVDRGYHATRVLSYRYTLTPGDYILIPRRISGTKDIRFYIRLFSDIMVPYSEIREPTQLFIRSPLKTDKEPTSDVDNKVSSVRGVYLEMEPDKPGKGSHIRSHQYIIKVKRGSSIPIRLALTQETVKPQIVLGFHVYAIKKASDFPLDRVYPKGLLVKPTEQPSNLQKTFNYQREYELSPGIYVVMLNTDEIKARKWVALTLHNYLKHNDVTFQTVV